MRPPAQIKSWLSIERMFQWLQAAPEQSAYKRRMAIWLTHTGRLHAHKVAEVLGISKQAVWLWIDQYNRLGPDGLNRQGRGGRRWGFMTLQQEAELLKPFIQKTQQGQSLKAAAIRPIVERSFGRKVSLPYIYRLLSRHGLGRVIAQSQLKDSKTNRPGNFRRISRPWTRS